MSPKDIVEAGPNGRPTESEYRKALRAKIRATEVLARLNEQAEELIKEGMEQFDYPEKELRKVAAARKDVARRLNDAMQWRNDAVRKGRDHPGDAAVEKEIASAKWLVSTLMDDIYALPDLGQTYAAWSTIPADMKGRPLGRPPLLLDVEIIRAEIKLGVAEVAFESAKKSATPEEIKQLKDQDELNRLKMRSHGRPQVHEIAEIWRQVKLLRAKIEGVKKGTDVGEEAISENGIKLGRKRRSKAEKIAAHQEKIDDLLEEIRLKESKLKGDALLTHNLWKLRNELRALRGKGAAKTQARAALAIQINDLEMRLYGRTSTKIEPAVRKAADNMLANPLLADLVPEELAAYHRAMADQTYSALLGGIDDPKKLKSSLKLLIQQGKKADGQREKTAGTVTAVRSLDDKGSIGRNSIGTAKTKARLNKVH